MKLADNPPKIVDDVIIEVRAIKRAISDRHGNNIDRLLDALIAQERSAETEQGGAGQPAAVPQVEGGDKPQPESQGRSW